ncbi:DEAD/DEAH box helicase [Paenibacillus tarimensis]
MSKTAEKRTWEIDGTWIAHRGIGLQPIGVPGPAQRLKNILFAWHEGTWYGENVEELVIDGNVMLLLSPMMAADYLSRPASVRLIRVVWTERMQLYADAASIIRDALLQGWYAPNRSGWHEGGLRWRLYIPDDSALERVKNWKSSAAGYGIDPGFLNEWITLAVTEAVQYDKHAMSSWRRLTSRIGDNLQTDGIYDEEDWLISTGWKKDDTPFRVILHLAEPSQGKGWRLEVRLHSREANDARIELQRHGDRWEATSGDLPDGWELFVREKLEREERKWLEALPALEEAGHLRLALTEPEAWSLLESGGLKLLEAGCSIMLPAWWEAVRSRKIRLKAKIRHSVGSSASPLFGLDTIVQFDWKMAVGEIDLSEAEFRKLAEENKRLVRIQNEWVHLDPGDLEQLRRWMKKSGKRGLSFREVLELHFKGGTDELLTQDEDAASAIRMEVELNDHLNRWMEQLQRLSGLPMVKKPEAFMGELRPYQLEGVSWLAFLRRFGLGGCLADDMGLGKTIQFTAYLLHIMEGRRDEGTKAPSLLICPTSVIGNWEKELQRFAPSIRVAIHYGPRRSKGEAFIEEVMKADLVITSYALATLDEGELGSVEWDALCLDEAQNIKNVYTKQSAAIRKLSARHRIAMTGTPMENRLTELWSIHDFMNPGYLGSLAAFRREVVQPIERTRDEALIGRLQRWVGPFMLRRVKKDPAIRLSLPDKNEAKTYISLTAEQGALYENLVTELLDNLNNLSPMKRRGLILATLTKLKQLCNHPSLVLKDERMRETEWDINRSNKITRLFEMVDEIAAEGDRCLIFTQFVGMGRMLQTLLQKRLGMDVPYLHGGVSKPGRDAMITEFQDPSIKRCAFVLSLKAGGTGLNLTAANHVVHFDRWWNPAVENQATDRAFRIGQTKDVQVYKFVTLGTLEEKIDDMITRKQQLSEQVVGQSENWITELSHGELSELFTLRKTWLSG